MHCVCNTVCALIILKRFLIILKCCTSLIIIKCCTHTPMQHTHTLAGNLPALERDADIAPGSSNEFAAARQAIQLAKTCVKNLDASLSPSQQATQLVCVMTSTPWCMAICVACCCIAWVQHTQTFAQIRAHTSSVAWYTLSCFTPSFCFQAFASLVQHRLEVATEYSIWCERQGYKEYVKVGLAG